MVYSTRWSRTTTLKTQGEYDYKEDNLVDETAEDGITDGEDCDKDNPWDNLEIVAFDDHVRILNGREMKHRTRLQKSLGIDEALDHDSTATVLGRVSLLDDYSHRRWLEEENEASHELTPRELAREQVKEIVHEMIEELSEIDNDMVYTKYGERGLEKDLAEKYNRKFQSINRTLGRIRTRFEKDLRTEFTDLLKEAGYIDD